MKQNQTGYKGRTSKMVPVQINGTQVMIDTNSIQKKDRTQHHGQTAAGVQVNSAASIDIGDSTIVWSRDGAPAVSFLKTDLEVFATQTLLKKGFKVQPPLYNQQ